MFNLSFLDLLSGALGAVIFLFIITPKGGEPSAKVPQVIASIDTSQQQIFGFLPDSLVNRNAGDTLLVLISGLKEMPGTEECPPMPPPTPCPVCPRCPEVKSIEQPIASAQPAVEQKEVVNKIREKPVKPSSPQKVLVKTPPPEKGYKGDPPSVPCKVSFEVTWEDIADNVDLFVCKDGSCVYGRKRKHSKIGFWDSGKSKIGWTIGGDVRTTLEAVRQFDQVIPGTYKLYAQFKDSKKNRSSVSIRGLVYTRGQNSKEKGERFYKTLKLNRKQRTLIGTVNLRADGSFSITK